MRPSPIRTGVRRRERRLGCVRSEGLVTDHPGLLGCPYGDGPQPIQQADPWLL